MMERLYFDFESYSACDLPAAGAWRYAEDATTEVLCFAWALGDGPVGSWMQGQPAPRAFLDAVATRQELWAWSANFEIAISTLVASRLPWWPKIPHEQWRCSQALAAMCSLPLSLDGCAAALGSPQRKDPEGSKLLTRFSRPRKPTKADARTRITLRDDPAGAAALVNYCRQDVVTERAIHHRLPIQALPPFEQRVWHVDSRINRRGVMVDVPMARGALAVIAGAVEIGRLKLHKATAGAITTANQGARIHAFCKARGVTLIDLTADTVAKVLRDGVADRDARAVLEVRASLAKASVAKYRRMLIAASPRDHRVRGVAHYHAAGTGRWGGRIVQFQNLPRPEFKVYDDLDVIRAGDSATLSLIYPDLMDAMRDAIRPTLRAKDGHVFAIADWAAIEARVLGWMFDEDTYLEAFRNGLDLYKVAAAGVFGVAYEDVTDDQRQLGKVIILALGYSMGEDRFYETCTEQYGLDVSRDLRQRDALARHQSLDLAYAQVAVVRCTVWDLKIHILDPFLRSRRGRPHQRAETRSGSGIDAPPSPPGARPRPPACRSSPRGRCPRRRTRSAAPGAARRSSPRDTRRSSRSCRRKNSAPGPPDGR